MNEETGSTLTYNPQELLAPAFLILQQPYSQKDSTVAQQEAAGPLKRQMDDISKASLMAANND